MAATQMEAARKRVRKKARHGRLAKKAMRMKRLRWKRTSKSTITRPVFTFLGVSASKSEVRIFSRLALEGAGGGWG